jgi:hypothetical protein
VFSVYWGVLLPGLKRPEYEAGICEMKFAVLTSYNFDVDKSEEDEQGK